MGLNYYNARWYDAGTGRFISEDPARDDAVWYAYCANSPLNFVDPTGMWTFSVGLSVQGSVLGGGQAGVGISISSSDRGGFQVGGYATSGGGAGSKAHALNLDFSVSSNDEIKNTGGWSTEKGGSAAYRGVGLGYSKNDSIGADSGIKPVHTGSVQLRPTPLGAEAHVFENYTAAGALLQFGGDADSGLFKFGLDNLEQLAKNVEDILNGEKTPDQIFENVNDPVTNRYEDDEVDKLREKEKAKDDNKDDDEDRERGLPQSMRTEDPDEDETDSDPVCE